MARLRLVGAMHAVAVVLPRANVVQVAVPDLVGVLRQGDALQLAAAGAVEEAELDLLGMGGEEREVHARAVPGGPERIGVAGTEPAHAPNPRGAGDSAAAAAVVPRSSCDRLACGIMCCPACSGERELRALVPAGFGSGGPAAADAGTFPPTLR